ncbi:hypothetical protein BDA99DRAFT_538785 [Phascolomyces articulosus]|uniref:Uncharacterized protein n=1 Tax=Phascolomyces articulosus TaxID=60185 RepID=A0AAD5PE73_9FUNG|nr:hypothetical protein BDA99DRAFT_538785 [Phascolomyces articulosus]
MTISVETINMALQMMYYSEIINFFQKRSYVEKIHRRQTHAKIFLGTYLKTTRENVCFIKWISCICISELVAAVFINLFSTYSIHWKANGCIIYSTINRWKIDNIPQSLEINCATDRYYISFITAAYIHHSDG